MKGIWLLAVAAAVGCGGGDDDVLQPEPLVDDPAVATGCLADPPAAGTARAKRVACAEELPPGRLTAGRIGDVVLQNARITVVIRGAGEGYYLPGTQLGGIVDAARAGGEDVLKEIQPVVDLNAGGFTELAITEAGDDGPATVIVRGPAIPVPLIDVAVSPQLVPAVIEQRYILAPDADEVLVQTVLWPEDGADGAVQHGDGLFFGGRVSAFLPGRGFIEGTQNAAFVASIGTTTSYGIAYPASVAAVQFLNIGGISVSLGPTVALAPGATVDRWLIIGDGSASSVTERGWTLRGVELGAVAGTTAPGASIEVTDGAGAPITIGRADGAGAYRIALPAGAYTLIATADERAPGTPVDVTVAADQDATADLPAGGTATLTLQVRDDGGAAIPARVVVTADGFERILYAGADGALSAGLPPGTYTVVASRGVEYDAFVITDLALADGATEHHDVTLTRVLDTAGWISMDTHLHSEMSTDSTIPLEHRLLAVAAEGVEIAVSTDHDFITDYGPIIDELGLAPFVATRVGAEVSSLVWGHINGWPLVPDYDRAAGGTPHWYYVAPGVVFGRIREHTADAIVQVNHPRTSSSGMFNLIDFNPDTLTANATPEDLGLAPDADLNDFGFDALEVANDFQGDSFDDGFRDWLALVAAGHPATATGSSDSHGASAYAGNSRTYVYVGDGADDPATLDLTLADDAVRARHAVVSQGAFVTAGVGLPAGGTSLPGDVVDVSANAEIDLHIRVQAPPWMPLARIRIYAGKTEISSIPLDTADTAAVRYDGVVTLPVPDADTFFVVRVDPAGRGAPVLGQPDASFTNPLLVDVEGDGWSADR